MSGLQVVFRADASLAIGTGHVMRCLTLADILRERGANCRFVCREHPGHLVALIRQRGFEVAALPLNDVDVAVGKGVDSQPIHAAWLGADWAEDAAQTAMALGQLPVDWLVVDHYALDVRWERQLRQVCRSVLVIDDLADRSHECELLLDQNLGRTAADYQRWVPAATKILAGPIYALLRPEFAALRRQSLARRAAPTLNHLLIAMGGVDQTNATGRVLDALGETSLPPHARITVVMGPHAPWLEDVRQRTAMLPWPVEVRCGVPDVASLMADSDLAIGAAGTTAWERCCLGLPTLTMVLADNQRSGAAALAAANAIVVLSSDVDGALDLREPIARLGQPSVLARLSESCAAITDGAGALRVAEEITNAIH